MKRFAVDTGPLVALLNRRDAAHRWVRAALEPIPAPLLTCEAVVSEACFLVSRLDGGPEAMLDLVARRAVCVAFDLQGEIEAVARLVAKYASVPMALADACLVRMSELDDDLTILTLDRHFTIYRRHNRHALPLIVPGKGRKPRG